MKTIPVFCRGNDALAAQINRQAEALYRQLLTLDISRLEITETHRHYFQQHHLGSRLIFSLQNSAHILYDSIRISGKPVNEICFMDYGAGLGTLFLLAGRMGFRKNMYNDHLPDWHPVARAICGQLGLQVDDYVTGDIDEVLRHAEAQGLQYDIIASRNVIEHIYNLPGFYASIHRHHPRCVVYATTTANYHNPVMRGYHVYLHRKFERVYYLQQRAGRIRELQPGLEEVVVQQLARQTRGRAGKDFDKAVDTLLAGQHPPADPTLRSNSCDCITGVWNEHLLKRTEYRHMIEKAGFRMQFTPGYWDTHYRYAVMNLFARCLNGLIRAAGNRAGLWLAPFVNVTAHP